MYQPLLSNQQTAQLSVMDMSALNPSLSNLQSRQLFSYGFTGSFLGFKQGMLIFCQFPVSFLRYKESSVFFLDSIGRPWLAVLFLRSGEGNLFYFLRPLLLLFRKDANYFLLFRIEENCLCTMDSRSFAQLQWLFNLKTHRQTTSLYLLTCNRQTKTSILCQVDN